MCDDLLQARHPHLSLLWRAGHQVKVLAFAFEDDGEGAVLHRIRSVLLMTLRAAALPHRVDVIDGDCEAEEQVSSTVAFYG